MKGMGPDPPKDWPFTSLFDRHKWKMPEDEEDEEQEKAFGFIVRDEDGSR